MATKAIFTDGRTVKSIDPWLDETLGAWTWYSGAPTGEKDLYSTVAYIYRAVNMTANAVASMPFGLYNKAGDEIDNTQDWQNVAGVIDNPRRLLRLVSMSLVLYGKSYLLKERNRVKVRDLTYLAPSTVEPTLDDVRGLTGFKRTTGGREYNFTADDIVYFWEPDPRVEIGPPLGWRLKAMLKAGGLLGAEDDFAINFLERGGVLPTMLIVKGVKAPGEIERLETYWDKFIRGWFKVAGKVFNGESLEPHTVGEGLSSLTDTTLTQEKREDICVAAGIPMSLMMSNAANYATALSDRRQWFENTILPDCELIADILTSQVFKPLGYHVAPQPETVDAFQEDENARAGAYSAYVSAGMKPSIAAQIVGIELPADIEYIDLDPEEEAEPEPQPEQLQPEMVDDEPEEMEPEEEPIPVRAWAVDCDRWQRKAINALRKGKSAAVEFESVSIPPELARQVCESLADATTPERVREIFAGAVGYTEPTITPLPEYEVKALLEAIKLGVEALGKVAE